MRMADCEEQIYSNDYYDFIVSYDEFPEEEFFADCVQRIDDNFDTFFYKREGLPPLDVASYTYTAIPKCYALLDQTALEASGILRIQNQPTLSLKGQGVLVGFIDTGIDYQNPVFQNADGTSRIYRIWDQTIRTGEKPAGFEYGSEYTTEQINEALRMKNPKELVPTEDENGHGTFLAGVACGGEDVANDFIGAAPQAEIVVVKLKEAKPYLRDFFFIPQDVPAYQENDIMSGISYIHQLANERNLPVVILLSLGDNMGSRGKDGPLSNYFNYICTRRKRIGITCTGNEANARRHFQGNLTDDMEYEDVQINVENDGPGFFAELWSNAPQLFAVSILSPSGERIPKISSREGKREEVTFLFEGSTISVDYRIVGREMGNQLIYMRFQNVVKGIWTIRVYPTNKTTGEYHVWLPMEQLSSTQVFFLKSNPDQTLTVPANAPLPITVGGYSVAGNSIYLDSGRGYTMTGAIKPDFVAPAVNVYGPARNNRYEMRTGTSIAGAITAGACAQILEWEVSKQKNTTITTADIKNMLIRGANRSTDRTYPNREWGYGRLDVYRAFEIIRET